MMKTEPKKQIVKMIFDTPTYHRGRSLEEQQERHRVGTGHNRVGKLYARVSDVTKLIHVFQECLDCNEVDPDFDENEYINPAYTEDRLSLLSKVELLIITKTRELPGNKQTSKTKLIETILKSY
ncbi:hypothetical protein LCGC14_2342710 [marine sediment metagenome]|uniref:Uncharacterized protein n=1 Tax=marine sediment metagenome TaxID=412755 RepID=A0A0F9CZ31_9ZZZZ